MDDPATTARRRAFRPLLFIGLWLALLIVGRERMFRDPGTFWHTVVGRQMLDTAQVVRTDPFTFSHAGEHWIAHQWLGEIAMALLDRLTGLDGLLLGAVTLLAATYAWAGDRLVQSGANPTIAVVLTLLTIAASSYHFLPRPHLISIALFGWMLGRLCDVEAGRRPRHSLVWLAPAFIVWTNCHGAALGGIVTLGIVAAGWLAIRPAGRASRGDGFQLGAIGIALTAVCAAATLVNPFGIELPKTWIALMRAGALPEIMIEHGPLSLRSIDGWMVLLLGAAYIVTLTRVPIAQFQMTWLMPLIWFALAISRIRHGPLFAIGALVVWRDVLAALRAQVVLGPKVGQRELVRSARDATLRNWARGAAPPILCLVTTLAIQVAGLRIPALGAGWARLDPAYWPIDALPALRSEVSRGASHARVMNEMLFGGFLTYFVPDARIWIDDRCELYGEPALVDYLNAYRHRPETIDDWAARLDASTALLRTGSPFDRALARSPRWRCAHRGAAGAVYSRTP
ncbi:MAG: hypothetical protein L6Q92_00105 [Phycisphaerae bacterium]|nr:hypothetical protein [Phycisphaerae bacterium]